MMNNSILFRFVLIALFLFAYQTTTIHSKHHHIEELSECHVCHASEALGALQHETSFSLVSESVATQVEEVAQKRVAKAAYDLTQTPLRKEVDLKGMLTFNVSAPPLGYYATAPPYFFS